MSATLIVSGISEADRMLTWAAMLAYSAGLKLDVVVVSQSDGAAEWTDIDLDSEDRTAELFDELRRVLKPDVPPDVSEQESDVSEQETASVDPAANQQNDSSWTVAGQRLMFPSVKRLRGSEPEKALLKRAAEKETQLLIIELDVAARGSGKAWQGILLQQAECETIELRVPGSSKATGTTILVPYTSEKDPVSALRRANRLAESSDGKVILLNVEPPLDAALDDDIGQLSVDRVIRRAIGRRPEHIQPQVVTAANINQGIESFLAQNKVDLVLLGIQRRKAVRERYLRGASRELFTGPEAPAFALVRSASPIAERSREAIERFARRLIPQMDRHGRVQLYDEIHRNSQWNADFVAMICLSTLIAALGLICDQGAVVIGAMLVAPLMTPLTAAGLAVVQSNYTLFAAAMRSVVYGFILACALSWLVGIAVTTEQHEMTHEIMLRTAPRPVDFAVAFVSGVAAAYALSRDDKLSAALPGVAIAAALVPPIAAAGICLANGYFRWSGGALLLFLTNILAIILGAACCLWMVGVRDAREQRTIKVWSRYLMGLLLIASVVVTWIVAHRAAESRRQGVRTLTRHVEEKLEQWPNGVSLVDLSVSPSDRRELNVVVDSPSKDVGSLAEEIRVMANQQFQSENMTVKLRIRRVVVAAPRRVSIPSSVE